MAEQLYKIKLASGRILGPIDIDRVRLLIRKNRILGTELARLYPQGDWQDINSIPAIAKALVESAADLTLDRTHGATYPWNSKTQMAAATTAVTTDPNATKVISPPPAPKPAVPPAASVPDEDEGEKTVVASAASLGAEAPAADSAAPAEVDADPERTMMVQAGATPPPGPPAFGGGISDDNLTPPPLELESPATPPPPPAGIGGEATVVLKLPGSPGAAAEAAASAERAVEDAKKARKKKIFEKVKLAAAIGAVLLLGYEFFLEPGKDANIVKFRPIRPNLPAFEAGKPQPDASSKSYFDAMPFYLADTVAGYKASAERFRRAAELDPGNVKALAMLASSYLNLIDASNKDETYFSVISKLIELSRAKNVDLPETVIADVEFYITVNKAEAAQNRLVEYTKIHPNFGPEMFYYLALAFYNRGDPQNASRFVSQLPDNKVFSPKVFYLRGLIADKLNTPDEATREYEKAIRMNPKHAKSRLRIAQILANSDRLKDGAVHLEFILNNTDLLPPKEMATAYFLHSRLSELFKNYEVALFDMERATRLDPENHDYLLQLYSMRAKSGEKNPQMKAEARMYYFLGEGERLLRAGNAQEALTQFLMARDQNDKSPLPLVKIGDMFSRQHDLGNARANYKMAADRAPNSIEIWSKYMDVLIQSYEWAEAQKAMDRFRKLNVSQSAIDKAAADMYAKQGKHAEAQVLYRKAMARDSIDPSVYIAYAKSLLTTRNCKDAPFFFALALRFDPLNTDALVGTAKCIAMTESIDRAVTMLQDELHKQEGAKAELLSAIAEFQIQRGDWAQAQASAEAAVAANGDYALPWKLLAQVYMNSAETDKTALDKALDAYESYSRRNASDPSGYLERYRIFTRKAEYEKANEELAKIYAIYPKYPNLHFYKGALYSVMGNHKAAVDEFKVELENNGENVITLIALGRTLSQMGAPNDALPYLNKAMQLAPRNSEAKMEAGYANHLLKNYQGAVALYTAALALDTGNPTLYKRLGLAYRDMGDHAKAGQAFRKYLEMEPDAPDKAQFERYR